MARRKKSTPKPATKPTVVISPAVQTVGGQQTVVDDAVPEEMEEVYTDSMLDFPEAGVHGPSDCIGTSVGDGLLEDVVEETTETAGKFQSQARDKWSQFRALLPNQGGAKLRFEEPIVQEGQRIAQVDLDEVQIESLFWSSAVVCQVLGANPPFAVFEGFIKRIWGKLGIERIARLNNGFTLVNFRDEVTRDLVLEAGVLHFDRKPVIVKPWSTDLDTLKVVKSVPVWIRLPGLGLQYWGTKCLSALMSTIGVPILVDKVTKDRSMMQFARVLVEIELSEDLPKSVQFLNEKGQLVEQFLEFEWLPTQCRGCKVYGHTVKVIEAGIPDTGPCDVVNGNEGSETLNVNNEEMDMPQETSKSAPVLSGVNQTRNPISKTNTGSNSDWITPKRVGGNKKATQRAKNTLTNSYSALQGKVLEVANLGLISTSGLLETKLRGDKIKKMMQSFFRGWSFFSGSVSDGRVLIIWQQHLVSVKVLHEIDQLVHTYVKGIRTNKEFCVTFVYGRNSIEERVSLWRDLTTLCFPATAWLITGDFNAVFESADRIGGRVILSIELSDAQSWRALGLVDEMRARGSHFTWTNNQKKDDKIYSRLDRVFANEGWLDIFPQSEAVFNWEMHSDHCYCIIKPEVSVNCGVKLFRFFNMWSNHEKFKATVLQNWCKSIRGIGLVCICYKLNRLQGVLQKFNRLSVGDVGQNFTMAKERFQAAQLSLQSDPHSVSLQRIETEAGIKLDYHARVYESFLKQKSKVDWLRFGDDNTAYFHACLKQRRASNCITSVVTETGQNIDKFTDVVNHFVTHFQKIMGSKSMASSPIQKSCFELGHRLTLEQQVSLVKPFSIKEVKEAMFSIKSIKSPGPDGFGSGFFKALWNELGTEISAAIIGFFDSGFLPEEINKATISLILKVETPSRATDYRPIACCNSIYKCISKMLCSRLALVLPSLVHPNQGAFVKNRLLAHNILILQDIIKGYKRKNTSPRCVLKIDLSKAYDMLDWNFLEDILTEFCFPVKFINWVMACLKDPTYLILMNGKVQGEFRGRKGLRQGDPISPLLFVLAMEYCTRLFQQASLDKRFRFHPKCKRLKLVNLCFADDLVIFCKGVNSSVQIIKESFYAFCCASGLTANKDKSQINFGGVADKEITSLIEGLQFSEGQFPLKYLGVPLRTSRWKAGDCSLIIKKIKSKLHTWASRHLSFAGRAQLINSVLLGIRSFWMSIFILPKSVIKEVDRLCRNFLWGVKDGNLQRSKLHFTTWDQVCLPKCMGGLGFKDSCMWNKVLLAKYIWAVSSKLDILWVKWVDSIYLKGQDFWLYRAPQDVSWYWKRLTKLRDDFPAVRLDEAVHHNKLCLKSLYHKLLNKDKVIFANVVWNSLSVPKHRFILWQATLGHLLTRDKLSLCHMDLPSLLCPVCEEDQESHAHLFFECPFSRLVVSQVKNWLGSGIWPSSIDGWSSWMAALWFGFEASNKEAEYEALLAGLRIASKLKEKVLGEYQARDIKMATYLDKVKATFRKFEFYAIEQVPWEKNSNAYALARLAATKEADALNVVSVEFLPVPSIAKPEE
ncbi:uncharacterized protein LOC133815521 [Humulus lupulus]|uniref:uncharacterized protein LOC133815521 n=1 Tax=Humulus lupulus TaxID=3486 RepID=UPI002B411D75|nr:uncharacterized protein LOC133815521 [Humulus lupulus]